VGIEQHGRSSLEILTPLTFLLMLLLMMIIINRSSRNISRTTSSYTYKCAQNALITLF
jgi:hypothetical protein